MIALRKGIWISYAVRALNEQEVNRREKPDSFQTKRRAFYIVTTQGNPL